MSPRRRWFATVAVGALCSLLLAAVPAERADALSVGVSGCTGILGGLRRNLRVTVYDSPVPAVFYVRQQSGNLSAWYPYTVQSLGGGDWRVVGNRPGGQGGSPPDLVVASIAAGGSMSAACI